MKQGDNAYAIAWTDVEGDAVFEGFTPTDISKIHMVASASGYYPKRDSISADPMPSSWYHLAYGGHTRDDDVSGGDGDDVFEAGETTSFEITIENKSTAADTLKSLWANLLATAPIICDLALTGAEDDDYEPEDIYIGASGGHPHPSIEGGDLTPPGWENEFRIPCNWEAIRTEEAYQGSHDQTESEMYFWRHGNGSYRIRTTCYLNDDSTFTGTLTTDGGFSGVSKIGESADSVFFDPGTDPNTLGFKFVGDATDDTLCFQAQDSTWLTMPAYSTPVGDIAFQGTGTASFDVITSETRPDRNDLVFTLAVRDTNGTYYYSDFFETIYSPEVALSALRSEWRQGTPRDTIAIWPTLANTGGASADSVVAVLRENNLDITPFRDTLTVEDIGSGTSEETEQPFLFTSPYKSDFYRDDLWVLTIDTYFPNGESTEVTQDDMDLNCPDEGSGMHLDEAGGGVVLRWTPPDTLTNRDLAGYHVYRAQPSDTSRITLVPIEGASRYHVAGLDTYDIGGDYIDYRYGVTSVDSSGNESSVVWSGVGNLWLPEHTGWPNYVDTQTRCAPLAFDIEGESAGLEVFAAGKAIYAWQADGDPLIVGNADGLFYDPCTDPDSVANFPQKEAIFHGGLAIADIDNDGKYEVVGNLDPYGVYVLQYNGLAPNKVTKEWFREASAKWCAPVLADLDGDKSLEVILSGGEDEYLYVWEADGNTFQRATDTTGEYRENSAGTTGNYGHVAIGELDSSSDGLEIVQSIGMHNSNGSANRVPSLVCWGTEDSTGTELWVTSIGSEVSEISTPVIGNIDDSDNELEIAVSRRTHGWADGGLWIVSDDGEVADSVEASALYFDEKSYATAPALADTSHSGSDLVIFKSAGREGELTVDWSTTIELIVYQGDESDTTRAIDDMPMPGRKHVSSRGMSQPAIGDIDGDSSLEVLISNNSGYLACFEASEGFEPEPGWPQLFPDIPLTPMIADVNADGDLDLLVADQSGAVHLLKLPGRASGADLPWPQYGHDAQNTSNYDGASPGKRGAPPDDDNAPLELTPPCVRIVVASS